MDDEKRLWKLSSEDKVEEVKDLLSNDRLIQGWIDVNCASEWRNSYAKHKSTLLHMAAYYNRPELTQVLLDAGANHSAQDKKGRTPLQWAIVRGHLDVVYLLINRGANPNIVDKIDNTPLREAIAWGYIDVVKALLDAGADPNQKCPQFGTPLFLAVGNGEKEITQLLLSRGANPCRKAESLGMTPLQLAEYGGNQRGKLEMYEDIADILRKYIKKGRKRRSQIITLHPGKRSRGL